MAFRSGSRASCQLRVPFLISRHWTRWIPKRLSTGLLTFPGGVLKAALVKARGMGPFQSIQPISPPFSAVGDSE